MRTQRKQGCDFRIEQLESRFMPAVNLGLGFNGPNNTGWQPPDTQLAVGPKQVLMAVNEDFAIFDKATGSLISRTSMVSFFAAQGFDTNGIGVFDPSILYDEGSGRFFFTGEVRDSTTSQGYIDIAVSTSSDLADGWSEFHAFPSDPSTWIDNGKIGVNAEAIVYGGNEYTFTDSFIKPVTISIRKSTLLDSNNNTLESYFASTTGFSVYPAKMHTSTAGGPMWLVSANWQGGNTIDVVRMDNALSSSPIFTHTNVSVPVYSSPPAGIQPEGSTINTNDCRTLNVEWSNNRIALGINTKANNDAAAGWYIFNASSTPVLEQSGTIHPANGVSTYYPAIAFDSTGNIGITYSESSSTEYPSMYVTGQIFGDPAGTLQSPALAVAGNAIVGGGRYGDYAGIAIDPVDQSFWAANEYGLSSSLWAVWAQNFIVNGGTTNNTPPFITQPAAANPSFVTGTTTNISVLADDAETGSSSLTYFWSSTGPEIVDFANNGTNTASNTVATFHNNGIYTFSVVARDPSGAFSEVSSVSVTVQSTISGIQVFPDIVSLANNQTQQFTAYSVDQFGDRGSAVPATWSVLAGGVGGAIDQNGLYTSPPTGGGNDTVQATYSGFTDTSIVQISVPNAPVLSGFLVSPTSIHLDWTNVNAVNYTLQRLASTGKQVWKTLIITPSTNYNDISVLPNKTYSYRVLATNQSGFSEWSNIVTISTPGKHGTPGGPPRGEQGGDALAPLIDRIKDPEVKVF